jgi:hypothetical protein
MLANANHSLLHRAYDACILVLKTSNVRCLNEQRHDKNDIVVANPLRYLGELVLQQSVNFQKLNHTASKQRVVSAIWAQIFYVLNSDHSRQYLHHLCAILSNRCTQPTL